MYLQSPLRSLFCSIYVSSGSETDGDNQVSGSLIEALGGVLGSHNGAMQSGSSSSNHSTDSSNDPNQRPRRAGASYSTRRAASLNQNMPRGQRMFQVRISPPEGPNNDTLEG